MRVDWAVAARDARVSTDGTMDIVGAGIDMLLVLGQDLPAQCEVTLALRVAGVIDEWQTAGHELTTTRIDPDRTPHRTASLALTAPEPPALWNPGMEVGLLLASRQEWDATELGLYTFDLEIDDHLARSVPILVRRV